MIGWRARNHPAYWAFLVHRLSGIALALFLPAHFLVLGQALRGEAALDGALRWTEVPLVKAAEVALVLLLAAHLAGGCASSRSSSSHGAAGRRASPRSPPARRSRWV